MSGRGAIKNFQDNLNRIGRTDPEKDNLYAGLSNLTKEVQGLRSDVAALKRELERLRRP